ncbi:MAG: MFS transporter, partial [Proteobacteria bacterium]|nr:MFS transporter [Pseudomonadota bacterium]
MPRLSAVPVYLALTVSGSFLFSLYGTLSALYRIRDAGLGPLELVLVGTALELSVFLFEIPTGVVADLYSRRLSIWIGYVGIGCGFLIESLNPRFAPILLGQLVWGLGYTFTSGATQAWLVDELGQEGVGRVFLRGSQAAQGGALLGIGAAVMLGQGALYLPLMSAGLGFLLLAGFVALAMPERGFRPRPRDERETWGRFGGTFVEGVGVIRAQPRLTWLLLIALLFGLASEPLDRLWELQLLDHFSFPVWLGATAILWFGGIRATSLVAGIGAVSAVRRRLDIDDPAVAGRALVWLSTGLVTAVAGFALAGSFGLAVACFVALSVLRSASDPIVATWINQQIPSAVRATVLSIHTQSDSLGQVAGGPALGALGRAAGTRAALLAS